MNVFSYFTYFPGSFSWYVCRECLLILKSWIMGRVGRRKLRGEDIY